MADAVETHQPGRSVDDLAAQLADRVEELELLTASLPDRPANLVALGAEALAVAGLRTLLEPKGDVAGPLRLAARSIGAAGALLGVDGPLQVDLGGPEPVTVGPLATRPADLNPRSIVEAVHAALATRDAVALELLAATPVERTTREPVPPEDAAYRLAHAHGLQALLRGDAAGNELLLDAIRGCADESLHPAARDYALLLVSTEIELTLLHRQADAEQFDQGLRNALVLHHRYWTEGEPNPVSGRTARPPASSRWGRWPGWRCDTTSGCRRRSGPVTCRCRWSRRRPRPERRPRRDRRRPSPRRPRAHPEPGPSRTPRATRAPTPARRG